MITKKNHIQNGYFLNKSSLIRIVYQREQDIARAFTRMIKKKILLIFISFIMFHTNYIYKTYLAILYTGCKMTIMVNKKNHFY